MHMQHALHVHAHVHTTCAYNMRLNDMYKQMRMSMYVKTYMCNMYAHAHVHVHVNVLSQLWLLSTLGE